MSNLVRTNGGTPPFLSSYYGVRYFNSILLTSDYVVTPVAKSVILSQIPLIFDVVVGDVVEINSAVSGVYLAYNDIGDTFKIKYFINSGTVTDTVTSTVIAGGDNSIEIAQGNLYTPILITQSGTINIQIDIMCFNNNQRTYSANRTGILAKVLRKIT